ncbi:General transcription factor IIH subunit 3 [Stylophora pistillata]|uniref:General transcription factor IIH subunit 3 n=1 Tax=Stylophora pistillata TaxID=50429 RepID=A0A2B4S6M2_STYPI|nr:General transcription factor IIH subunit 3 [Stylophora pistillata]
MADENISNLLVVILDANPVWWGRTSNEEQQRISLTHCVDSLMVFCNAHLMMQHSNCLSFIISHTNTSKFVFPKEDSGEDISGNGQKELLTDGKYEGFAEVNDAIITEMKSLLSTEDLTDSQSTELPPTLLANALTMALCLLWPEGRPVIGNVANFVRGYKPKAPCQVFPYAYLGSTFTQVFINIYTVTALPEVLKAAPDVSTQYMPIMNCIFAAQKSNTMIDACVVDEHSGFLQQAADITGGMYLKVPQTLALLQYLLNTMIDACVVDEHSGFLQQAADITGGMYLKVPQTLALLQYLLFIASLFLSVSLAKAKLKPTFEWLLKKYFRNYYSKGGITGQCNFCTWTESQFSFLAILLSVETPQELCYQRTRFKLPALPLARPKKKKKENTAPGK